jgi:ribonucleoside-diphosphate reductase alpha chain
MRAKEYMQSSYLGISIDEGRDSLLSDEGKTLAEKFYTNGLSFQKALARTCNAYSYGDSGLAQRMYDYFSTSMAFPSSPILSNSPVGVWREGTPHNTKEFWEASPEYRKSFWEGDNPSAMPIACFLAFIPDSIKGQIETIAEVSHLSVLGGGTAVHSSIRAVSEKAPGPIPYIKSLDGIMGYYRQAKTRKGSLAVYIDISHPDIIEFIKMRTASGGDPARKIDNRAGVHHGVNISEAFIKAYEAGADWELVCPKTGVVRDVVKASDLWIDILKAREVTGEPFMWFIDVVNADLPAAQKALGLRNNGSNLCSEISLATNEDRTAVCCLSSLNLEFYDEWINTSLVADLTKFLDNVLQWFIDFAPEELRRAKFSAERERAIGIGAMGFAYHLQRKGIAFESGGFNSAVQRNVIIFNNINKQAKAASAALAETRGEPADLISTGYRNSHLIAIAPNSNSSILCNTSASCEPIPSNAFTRKGRAGVFVSKNKYLEQYLTKKDLNTPEMWDRIVKAKGSIQEIDEIPEEIKAVFKTAWEIDQHWVVQHAEDRQPFVCQAQSTNLYFPPKTDRAYISSVHLKAAKGRKIKSLYYFRTGAETVADTIRQVNRERVKDWNEGSCVACEA